MFREIKSSSCRSIATCSRAKPRPANRRDKLLESATAGERTCGTAYLRNDVTLSAVALSAVALSVLNPLLDHKEPNERAVLQEGTHLAPPRLPPIVTAYL